MLYPLRVKRAHTIQVLDQEGKYYLEFAAFQELLYRVFIILYLGCEKLFGLVAEV